MLSYLLRKWLEKTIDFSEPIVEFSFGIFLLSVISLIAFFNLLFFLILNYYLNEDNMIKLKNMLPNIIFKMFLIYKKMSILTILIESVFGVFCLSSLIWVSLKIMLH